jgi:hypothetical protein
MPDFQQLLRRARRPGAACSGSTCRTHPSNAQAFVDELGITYDLASDPAGELYAAVGGFGMPTTLFVDPEGTIVYRHTGPLDTAELRRSWPSAWTLRSEGTLSVRRRCPSPCTVGGVRPRSVE